MPENGMQLIILAARAVFLLLAGLIVLRSAMNLFRQHAARRKLLRSLPDAGLVGELREIESDRSYPLAREGVLGGGRGCDIRLRGLRRRMLTFAYVPGKGILLSPCRRRLALWLDGVELRRPAYALHGMLLRAGDYTLCVRLFAGLDVPQTASLQPGWETEEEDGDALCEPDETVFTPVPAVWDEWRQAAQPPEETEDPAPIAYTPAPDPSQDDGAPMVRHRRSDRRRGS